MSIIRSFSVSLDLDKETCNSAIKVRRNDYDSAVLVISITRNGNPVDITGYTPFFECTIRGKFVRDGNLSVVDPKSGRINYTIPNILFSFIGTISGYIVLEQVNPAGENEVDRISTYNFGVTIFSDAMEGSMPASSGSIINNTSGKFPCSYRGIENPFGSLCKFVDGLNINNGQTWVAKNADDYASNVFANPYEAIGYENVHDNGWVKDMGFDPDHPYVQLPTSLGGNDSSYYSDYHWQNPTGQFIARVGTYWNGGSGAGLSTWDLSGTVGWAGVDGGGRLLKKAL